ncbi:MAG: patatin-like phospholipase family protein [Spirochaetes bacterium]|nr:patatin-like phospholipase family protein [Spirochaetota bacterium]
MFNPLKIFKNTKVGIALGSGGAKGVAHIAVLDYCIKKEIPISMIAGSSIGAVIGSLYAYGALPEFTAFLKSVKGNDLFAYFDPVFPKTGLIQGKRVMELLSKFIPKSVDLEDLSIPVAIVATDFYTGKPVVFKKGNVLDAIRASISIPGIFVPVKYMDTVLIDGGVSNPLPIDVVKQMGAGIIIAVNLHPTIKVKRAIAPTIIQNKTAHTENSSNDIIEHVDKDLLDTQAVVAKQAKGWLHSVKRWLGVSTEQSNKTQNQDAMPNIFEIVAGTIDIMEYMNTTLMITYNKPDVLVEPNLVEVGTLDFTKVDILLHEGFAACQRVEKDITRKVVRWM